MNAKQLQKIKTRLLEQLDSVTKELETHADGTGVARSEVEESIVRSDDQLVQKITLALKQIDDGTYGQCSGCGAEISIERLEAKPSVSLCTACQEKKEAQA